MNYGDIIKKAWKSMWKYPVLWIFAILAGQTTIRSLIIILIPHNQPMLALIDDPIRQYLYQVKYQYNMNAEGIILYLFFGVMIVLTLIRGLVSMVGSIGLQRGVVNVREGKKLDFKALFKETQHFFWRMLAFNGLSLLLGAILSGPIILVALQNKELYDVLGIFILLFCSMLILLLIPFWLVSYGTNIMLVNDWSIKDSIAEALNFVIRKHFWDFFGIAFVSGLVAGGISILLGIPQFAVSLISGVSIRNRLINSVSIDMAMDTLTQLAAIFLVVYGAWSTGLLTVFSSTVGVHAYLDLKDTEGEQGLELPTYTGDYLTPKPQGEILFNTPDEVPEDDGYYGEDESTEG